MKHLRPPGSAQYSHQKNNPFTAGERYLMIDRALRSEGITDFSIVPVEDLNRYSVWVSHVESMCPPFSRVYTNNPMTRRLFEEAGYEVLHSHIYNRDYYSGTEIRRRMVAGEDWSDSAAHLERTSIWPRCRGWNLPMTSE